MAKALKTPTPAPNEPQETDKVAAPNDTEEPDRQEAAPAPARKRAVAAKPAEVDPFAPLEILESDSLRVKKAKQIFNWGERVQVYVHAPAAAVTKKPGYKPRLVLLAEINDIPFYGREGSLCVQPAEVARIAEAAGLVTVPQGLPEGFTNVEPWTPYMTGLAEGPGGGGAVNVG